MKRRSGLALILPLLAATGLMALAVGGQQDAAPAPAPAQAAADAAVAAVADAAAQPGGSTEALLAALAAGGAPSSGPGPAPAARRRLQQAAPDRPGLFMGGPTLTGQHSSYAADSPEFDITKETGASKSSGASGALDANLVKSLTNDMLFAVKYAQKPTTGRRRLRAADPPASPKQPFAPPPPPPPPAGQFQAYAPSAFALSAEELKRQAAEQAALEKKLFGASYGLASAPPAPRVAAAVVRAEAEAAGAEAESEAARAHAHGDADSSIGGARRSLASAAAAPRKAAREPGGGREGRPLHGVAYRWRGHGPRCGSVGPAADAPHVDKSEGACRCPTREEVEDDLEEMLAPRFRTLSVACPDALRMLLHFVASVPGTGLVIGVDAAASPASAPPAAVQIEMLGQLLAAQPAAAARVEAVVVGSGAGGAVIAEATLIEAMRQARATLATAAAAAGAARVAAIPVAAAAPAGAWTARLAAESDFVGIELSASDFGPIDATKEGWAGLAASRAAAAAGALSARHAPKRVIVCSVAPPPLPRGAGKDSEAAAQAFAAAWDKARTAAREAGLGYYYESWWA
ncbi:hypothetical protein Rsub_02196 [Raphidocelis subcapitata]|uniref:Uncharacterized protein n=1 Tax=Raphidocelis subcapitata TaxID=307507 RepID=A0A2V0NPW2_9CHLO|nr:hypothetical protein Rsub_02196 [Raphidocelis subcapitata]|eukprot:GBF89319.1 hypothetical protein Rsub_02196 [Raphidocelis subcapitata]